MGKASAKCRAAQTVERADTRVKTAQNQGFLNILDLPEPSCGTPASLPQRKNTAHTANANIR